MRVGLSFRQTAQTSAEIYQNSIHIDGLSKHYDSCMLTGDEGTQHVAVSCCGGYQVIIYWDSAMLLHILGRTKKAALCSWNCGA